MSRLPVPGSDDNIWGNVLNDFLSVSLNSDGSLKSSAVVTSGAEQTTNKGQANGYVALDAGSKINISNIPTGTSSTTVAMGNDSRITGAIQATTATAKGDLLAATAASTISRFGVGSDGQHLTADSTQPSGLRWSNAATNVFLYAADFGATFDGSTDDATALQNAINAAISANKPLMLSPGTTIVGTPLSVASPITIIGAGRQSTTLKAKNALNDYVIKFTGGTGGGGIIGAHFSDFTVDGNAANQTAGGGILANGAVQCSFERLHLTSCYDWGLLLGPITGGAFGHHNRVVQCLFDSNGVVSAGKGGGVTTTSSDENWFYGTDFEQLGGSTNPIGSSPIMFYDQCGLQHIVGANFVNGKNNCIGVRVQNAKDTKIEGCTFDGTAGDSIFISGSRCLIVGNVFTSPGDAGTVAASGVHLEFDTFSNVVIGNVLETSNNAGKTRSLIREEGTGGSNNNIILGNTLTQNAAPTTVALLESAGTNTIVRSNIGWTTEASGTATIASAATSVVVNHGLSMTPTTGNLSVTATNNLGSATRFWVSNVTSTQFTINVDVAPGASTATFAWNARL